MSDAEKPDTPVSSPPERPGEKSSEESAGLGCAIVIAASLAFGAPMLARWLWGWTLIPESATWQWVWWIGAVVEFFVLVWLLGLSSENRKK
jgi:hypothetical protein